MTPRSATKDAPAQIRLATLLLPWRLVVAILGSPDNPRLLGRIVLALGYSAALCAVLSVSAALLTHGGLSICIAALAGYCTTLLCLTFITLNAVSTQT